MILYFLFLFSCYPLFVHSYTIQGEYFWELLFSYNNLNNSDSITEKYTVVSQTHVTYKTVTTETLHVSSGFKTDGEFNMGFELAGFKLGAKVDYEYHIDMASDISRSMDTVKEIDVTTTVEKVWNIGPHSTLSVYRLCYMAGDSSVMHTDVTASSPLNGTWVQTNFNILYKILGLRTMLSTLENIRPGSDNRDEWTAIRNEIISNYDKSDQVQFISLVKQFYKTVPARDNRDEWTSIRQTCGEILNDYNEENSQAQFLKLCNRLNQIYPGSSNRDEWTTIRKTASTVLSSVTEVEL